MSRAPGSESATLRDIGGEVHKILNETIARRLTVQEYSKVVKGVGSLMTEAEKRGREEASSYIDGVLRNEIHSHEGSHHHTIHSADLEKLIARARSLPEEQK